MKSRPIIDAVGDVKSKPRRCGCVVTEESLRVVGDAPKSHHGIHIEFHQDRERLLDESITEEFPVVLAVEYPVGLYAGVQPINALDLPLGGGELTMTSIFP